MKFNFPKNDKKYHWTQHCVRKMLFYGLSADRIKRVIKNPKRTEEGIAPDTLAAMQPAGTKKKPTEIWVMYARGGGRSEQRTKRALRARSEGGERSRSPSPRIIITAWRYPGISPVRDEIPIPVDILEELRTEGVL